MIKTTEGTKWSKEVAEHSHALKLEKGIFTDKDPKKIAKALKVAAEESTERKGTALQSAMSMLDFYINRAGKNLDEEHKNILNSAKEELRILFKKDNSNS